MAKTETKAAESEDQSMEEILQSIRRIIAEEGDAPAVPAAAEADVLELTDMVTENGAVVNVAEVQVESSVGEVEFEPMAPAPMDDSNDVLAPAAPAEDVLKNIDDFIGVPATPATSSDFNIDTLLSPVAAEATSQALKNLKRSAVPPAVDSTAFRNGVTVEDLVVEGLKPMLKAWLDENLPIIIERIVEREIRKLT